MPKRKLAAIMFTDMVGFAQLSHTRESKALRLIEINRQHQKSIIKKYGTFIKEMGDGIMARFTSAINAITCAYEIQSTVPLELSDRIRIGIHLGDILVDNRDVFGDGVNIASRLESIAEPGSIYISDSIYSAIKSRGDIKVEFVGVKELKNISDPIRCYRIVHVEDSALLSTVKSTPRLLHWGSLILVSLVTAAVIIITNSKKVENTPALTVLPFNQIEGDTSSQFLEEGITEELIRTLGRNNDLFVINQVTSFHYQASINPFQDARNDLTQADYFIEGNYQMDNNLITLNIRLLGRSEKEFFSQSYKKDVAFLPELIGNIANELSSSILGDKNIEERNRITEIKNIDPEVYKLYLKGMTILGRYKFEEYPLGISLLEEAKERYPTDSRAWAGLAEGYVWLGHAPNPPPADAWRKAKAAAIRAIQLDSTNAEAWAALAHTKTYFEWDYAGAQIGYQKANDLNPNNAFNHYHYAWHLYLLDSLDKAIEEHKIAQALDPFEPIHTFWLAALLLQKGEYEKGKKEIFKSLEIDSNLFVPYRILSLIYLAEGKLDSAEYAINKAVELQPFMRYYGYMPYCFDVGNTEEGLMILKEAQHFPENPFLSYLLARTFAQIDSAEQFFYYANYEPTHAFHPWLRKAKTSERILKDPRYKQLMEKMNLPMPIIDKNGI